jgi:hypothetical protein
MPSFVYRPHPGVQGEIAWQHVLCVRAGRIVDYCERVGEELVVDQRGRNETLWNLGEVPELPALACQMVDRITAKVRQLAST